jgi:hypothetical protein
VAGVGSLGDKIVEVDLHCIPVVDHLVMVVIQKSQSALVQQTECGNVPW